MLQVSSDCSRNFGEISFGKLKLASMNIFLPLGENIAETIISVSAKKNKKKGHFKESEVKENF